jgi:CRP/FNR family cyclic AMP-dependent transcriptional regulator
MEQSTHPRVMENGMQRQEDMIDVLAGFALFADLSRPQLEAVVHTLEEEWFAPGQRVLRQGFAGTGLYFIVEGEAVVEIDGAERARLGRGEFFGEVSVLLGDPPVADVAAATPMRCMVLSEPDVEAFLLSHPPVMFRMLQTQARRLRSANLWQG